MFPLFVVGRKLKRVRPVGNGRLQPKSDEPVGIWWRDRVHDQSSVDSGFDAAYLTSPLSFDVGSFGG